MLNPGITEWEGILYEDSDYRVYGKSYDKHARKDLQKGFLFVAPGGGMNLSLYDPFCKEMCDRGYTVFSMEYLSERSRAKKKIRDFGDAVDMVNTSISHLSGVFKGKKYLFGDSLGAGLGAMAIESVDASVLHGMPDMGTGFSKLSAFDKLMMNALFLYSNVQDVHIPTIGFINSLADEKTKSYIKDSILKDKRSERKSTVDVPARALKGIDRYSTIEAIRNAHKPVQILDSEHDNFSKMIRDKVEKAAKINAHIEHRIIEETTHPWVLTDSEECARIADEFYTKSSKK
jgi:hypothetical protein